MLTTLSFTSDRGFQGAAVSCVPPPPQGVHLLAGQEEVGRERGKASPFRPGEEERESFLFRVSPNRAQCDLSLPSISGGQTNLGQL